MKVSLKNKLVFTIMASGALVLVLSMGGYLWLDIINIRNNRLEDTRVLAKIIAENNQAAILFNDTISARESLTSLKANTDIEYVCILDKDKNVFAESNFTSENIVPPKDKDGIDKDTRLIELLYDIELQDEIVGTLYIRSNLNHVNVQIKKALLISLVILFLAIFITYVLTWFLQNLITKPILELAEISSRISKGKDYSTTIKMERDDEIGVLVKSFNKMLKEIDIQNRALMRSKLKAEKSSKAKEQFLANMSHEIRTPLNGIEGMTKLLEGTILDEEQKKYMSTINISSGNLMIIINDILDVSKIEAGKLTVEEVDFDLKNSCGITIETLAFKAKSKNISLEHNFDKNISEVLIGDPTRINQVIINLINNAIKFTEKGFVKLNCSLIEKTENSNKIRFEVVDSGIGIARNKLDKIFESFSQEDDSTTRKFGGTGLGLSISRQLVELFNGKLEVSSVKGEGTSFYFTIELPIGIKEKIDIGGEILDLPVSLDNKRVLLVEDNEINQFLASTILKKWKMEVDIAENGLEALNMLKRKTYDVILMDVQMPVMGGLESTRNIREKLKLETPIIALTANAIKGDDDKCFNAGMDDYVSKPFDHSILFNKILKLINYGRETM